MRRFLVLAATLVAGTALGGSLMLAVQSGATVVEQVPGATAVTGSTVPAATPTTETSDATTSPAATGPPATAGPEANPAPSSDQAMLAWTPGSLPADLAARVATLSGVSAVTAVRSDLLHLVESRDAEGNLVDHPTDGFVIPLEVMGFDPTTYLAFVSKEQSAVFSDLASGELLLGATSARLRRLEPGGTLEFEDGSRFVVTGIVDDVLIGAAEAAISVTDERATGIATERYLLIRHDGIRKDLESAIRSELPEGVPIRIRAPGETPVLRHGDAVLPPVFIKDRFGEFAYRPGDGLSFDIEPGWIEDNIVTADVPVLGAVQCHRAFLPALKGAMAELADRNLAFLVDPKGFRGCWNPRYIADRKGISRHAWGVAVDVNVGYNPQGAESAQDPRLLEVLERWGLTSGHDWLIPDPGHFEYLRAPTQTQR